MHTYVYVNIATLKIYIYVCVYFTSLLEEAREGGRMIERE